MAASTTTRVLVVIGGAQAVGKSTIAAALADVLRQDGEAVALVALDGIAEMALPTLPSWAAASAIFEAVVGGWARAGVDVVIAEGAGEADEVRRLAARAPTATAVVVVGLVSSLDAAHARAQADPSRGASKDRAFLAAAHARWAEALPGLRPDLVLRTDEHPVEECVESIRSAVGGACRDALAAAPPTGR